MNRKNNMAVIIPIVIGVVIAVAAVVIGIVISNKNKASDSEVAQQAPSQVQAESSQAVAQAKAPSETANTAEDTTPKSGGSAAEDFQKGQAIKNALKDSSQDDSSDLGNEDTDMSDSGMNTGDNEGNVQTPEFDEEFYSTDETANIGDVEWFDAWIMMGQAPSGFENAIPISSPEQMNGGWRMYMRYDPNGSYTSDNVQRFMHADIYTSGTNVRVNMKFGSMFDQSSGKSYDETGDGDELTGPLTTDNIGFSASGSIGKLDITDVFFYQEKQFAIGLFTWVSGEKDVVALMRPNGSFSFDFEGSGGSSNVPGNTDDSGKSNGSANQGGSYTQDQIMNAAQKFTGAPVVALDSTDPDGTMNIHCYENVRESDGTERISTWNWLYINPKTLKGTDVLGEPVDLSDYI
ncbi:MAG: hypothetical protein K5989_12605 [Lachnospiraceae bacterium]|nr:hypothetical protein [Lachnospiraceae bacterium]